MSTIAVILPAYNEEKTITEVVQAFHNAMPEALICVIDNNSSDSTASLALNAFAELGVEGRLISEPQLGKGKAVRTAFREVEADIYVICDADCTYSAKEVSSLIKPVADGSADMVVGDRHSSGDYLKENKRPLHNFGNTAVRWLVNKLFQANLNDIMSGFRAFNRRFVKNYPILVDGFQLETDMTLHALDKRFRILEIPISYKDRPTGSHSKLNTLIDGARVIFVIIQVFRYYKPLMFFGGVSVVFCLAGLLAGIPVLQDWFQHKYIYHVPLAILAASLEIVAVLALSLGLVLDSINHQYRMEFERGQLRDES